MTSITLQSIGLDADEALALAVAGEKVLKQSSVHFEDRDLEKTDRFEDNLKRLIKLKQMTHVEARKMSAAYRFAKAAPSRYEPLMPAVQQKEGLYTQHESFACVSQNMTSTNSPCFVGTPCMDGTMVALEFSRAKMDFSDMQSQETRLYEGAALLRLYLSADQFATLLRDRRSESPCGLSRLEGTYLDNPPRMISTVSLVAQAKRVAMDIGAPLITAANDLEQYLAQGEKISTKADYAELRIKIEAVCEAMIAIRPPMQAMLKGFAGEVAEAAVKQMLADIQEPLKALGMSPNQLLTHII